jgi:hypothetical protein
MLSQLKVAQAVTKQRRRRESKNREGKAALAEAEEANLRIAAELAVAGKQRVAAEQRLAMSNALADAQRAMAERERRRGRAVAERVATRQMVAEAEAAEAAEAAAGLEAAEAEAAELAAEEEEEASFQLQRVLQVVSAAPSRWALAASTMYPLSNPLLCIPCPTPSRWALAASTALRVLQRHSNVEMALEHSAAQRMARLRKQRFLAAWFGAGRGPAKRNGQWRVEQLLCCLRAACLGRASALWVSALLACISRWHRFASFACCSLALGRLALAVRDFGPRGCVQVRLTFVCYLR